MVLIHSAVSGKDRVVSCPSYRAAAASLEESPKGPFLTQCSPVEHDPV